MSGVFSVHLVILRYALLRLLMPSRVLRATTYFMRRETTVTVAPIVVREVRSLVISVLAPALVEALKGGVCLLRMWEVSHRECVRTAFFIDGTEDRPNYAASVLAALCADKTAAAEIMHLLLVLFAEATEEGKCVRCPVLYDSSNIIQEHAGLCWLHIYLLGFVAIQALNCRA